MRMLLVGLNFPVIAGIILWQHASSCGAFRDRTASIQKAMQEARRQRRSRSLAEIEGAWELDTESPRCATPGKRGGGGRARIKAARGKCAKIVQSAEQEIASLSDRPAELTAFAQTCRCAGAETDSCASTDQRSVQVLRTVGFAPWSGGTSGKGRGSLRWPSVASS